MIEANFMVDDHVHRITLPKDLICGDILMLGFVGRVTNRLAI